MSHDQRKPTMARLPALSSRHCRTGRTVLTGALLAGVAISPVAWAGAPSTRFVMPGSYGTVDFGDRVPYRLQGATCAKDLVKVVVTTQLNAAGAPTRTTSGPASKPRRDADAPGTCTGLASVPAEAAVRQTGWQEGDHIAITITSKADQVPLVYQRVHTAFAKVVSGSPTVVTPTVQDPRAGAREKAVEMHTGDAISLGRVDLTHIDAITLRLCITMTKPRMTPSLMELRERTPNGPSVIGTVDVADDYPLSSPQMHSLSDGWPNCWWLEPIPVNGTVTQRAPELFLTMDATVSPIQISYVDFNGTGAKAPDVAPKDPAGMTAMPWSDWSMTHCVVDDDGTVRNDPDTSPVGYAPEVTGGLVGPAGCDMKYTKHRLHNVLLRFEFKFGSFADNGDIMVGGHEVQMRIAGEWLPGGLYGSVPPSSFVPVGIPDQLGVSSGGGYPAERLKENSYSDWNEVEILQLGSHHVVRINGRTVADSTTAWPDPAPYTFSVGSQPQFGYDYRADIRYDNALVPQLNQPSSWSNLVWRNFRVYTCTSAADPICHLPGVHG
jgi:hypothetical protein